MFCKEDRLQRILQSPPSCLYLQASKIFLFQCKFFRRDNIDGGQYLKVCFFLSGTVVAPRDGSKHKSLSAVLAASGQGASRNPLKSVPSLEVAAPTVERTLPVPQILLVVFGQQSVEERVDATVAVRQACGQVVNVPCGLLRNWEVFIILGEQLPYPERQETGPEDQHYGED